MTPSPVRWVSAFLDTPAEPYDETVSFWTAVTATEVGQHQGDLGEYAQLEPSSGDPCLWLQRIQDGPVSCHPDLYVEDVVSVARRAVELGATRTSETDGLIVSTSPGGLPFCLVRHRGQSLRPEPVGPRGGRSVVDQFCIDIPPGRLEEERGFWSELTGWERVPAGDFQRLVRPEQIPYAFLLQELDDERPTVTAHLDLACDDRDAETARQQSLGADAVRRTSGWTVMRDPTGRTYCNTGRAPGEV